MHTFIYPVTLTKHIHIIKFMFENIFAALSILICPFIGSEFDVFGMDLSNV